MEPEQISLDQNLPCLSQNPESYAQIFYIDSHYECRIKELQGTRIQACYHGWVILSDHPDNVLWSLWNPLTSKLIRLPPLTHREKDSYECCLSAPPDDQGSVFLLLSDSTPTIVYCRLDRHMVNIKWTEMSYAEQLRSISGEDGCFLSSLTCCNGKVYTMFLRPYMFVVQVDIVVKGEEEVVINLLPFVKSPSFSSNRCPPHNNLRYGYAFLKGSYTELFYIFVGCKDEMRKMIVDVYLFKLDMTSMMWKEMVDLEDAAFFLGLADDCSICHYSSAVDSKLGGYIHILGKSGELIYSFHAKDRTVSLSSLSCPVRESQASTWAMLEWRLEADHAKSKQEEEDKDIEVALSPVKGDQSEIDSTTGESHLLNMPFHMLQFIMELCIGVEYMKFRATCKHLYLAARPIKWSNKKTLSRFQEYSLVSPWLMLLDNYRDTITFIDPIFGDRYFMKTPQELKGGYQIYCSRFGWLLMYKIDGPLVFFNPFTNDIRKLPVVPYLESFCFSAPPTSPDCMVVGFTTCWQWHVYIHFVSKESSWRAYGLNFAGDDPYSFQFPAFNGRDIYALCNNERVEAFRDMHIDHYSWEAVTEEAPVSCCKSSAQHFLSKCDQHLLLVIIGEFGESVEVFRLNESTEEWEIMDGLGKHMIYISDTSCICLEAKSPEMGNKIYFPRLLHDDNAKIVFYSLQTCRYHTFDDKNIQESLGADLFGTKHLCHPHTWIEPSWS